MEKFSGLTCCVAQQLDKCEWKTKHDQLLTDMNSVYCAVPALLSACESALVLLEGQEPIATQLRAVIAKAKGE